MHEFAQLTELTAATRDFIMPGVQNLVFRSRPMLAGMRARQRYFDSGEYIRVPMAVSNDPNDLTGRAMSPTGTFSFENPRLFDAARFDYKYVITVTCVWDYEIAAVKGEAAYFDLIRYREAVHAQLAAERMNRYMFGKGEGTLQPNGLGDIFDKSATYGGIDRTQSDVFNTYNSSVGASGQISTYHLGDLQSSCEDQMSGTLSPDGDDMSAEKLDGFFTTQPVWNHGRHRLETQQRYPNQGGTDTAAAQAGFKNWTYAGTPVFMDKGMLVKSTTNHPIYALNFDHFFFMVHEKFNYVASPWMNMPNNWGIYRTSKWVGQSVSNNLRYLGVLEGLNPTKFAT